MTDFTGVIFETEANFSDTTFAKKLVLFNSIFKTEAIFFGAKFFEKINLRRTRYTTFRSYWDQIIGRLDEPLHRINDKINSGNPDTSSIEKTEYDEWNEVYLNLIRNFKGIGDSETANNIYYYYRKKRQKFNIEEGRIIGRGLPEKIQEKANFVAWGLTSGYRVKPSRPLILGGILMISFSSMYFFIGRKSERAALVFQKTGDKLSYEPTKIQISNCLYFSVVTFTTIGYGDLEPKGTFKLLAVIEGTAGWLTMAPFLVTLANYGSKIQQ